MKDSDRREDKGRHYCLGDRTDFIPRRASYYAKVWFEERVEFILFFISSWCNSSFGPFPHIVQVQFILFFKLSWCKTASAARNWINPVPQATATTLPLLLCLSPFSTSIALYLFCGEGGVFTASNPLICLSHMFIPLEDQISSILQAMVIATDLLWNKCSGPD